MVEWRGYLCVFVGLRVGERLFWGRVRGYRNDGEYLGMYRGRRIKIGVVLLRVAEC